MSVRHYAISDPPTTKLRQLIKDTNGTPSVAWQQYMEKAYIKTYKIIQNEGPDRYYDMDYTKDSETQFRPSQLIEDYNPRYFGTEYRKDPYWDEELFDQENLHLRLDDYLPTDHEDNPEIKDNERTRALIELWQTNSEANNMEEKAEYQRQEVHHIPNNLLDEKAFLHLLVTKEGVPAYIPLSTNLGLKFKQRRMLYFAMDFGELTLDGLIYTGVPFKRNPRSRPQ